MPRRRREWDRMTDLIRLFVASGAVAGERPASLLLVGAPGRGKTELLERFRPCVSLSYHSDLTVRSFWGVMKKADRQRRLGTLKMSHLVFTEFQKLFQRKASVWENCVGTLCQAMEEGVVDIDVGGETQSFDHVRLGLLGAMTMRTLKRRGPDMEDMGLLSRACVLPWELTKDEVADIMDRIAHANTRDLKPINVTLPKKPVPISMRPHYHRPIKEYVARVHPATSLRLFQRLALLVKADALIHGQTAVRKENLTRVLDGFVDYWDELITEVKEIETANVK